MSLCIETLAADDAGSDWQAFVDAQPQPGPCHHAGWLTAIAQSFSVTPHRLMARRSDGAVAGILPLYESRSLLFGSELTSLEGGILAEGGETAEALFQAAQSLRRERNLPRLVLRGGEMPHQKPDAVSRHVHTVVATDRAAGTIWSNLGSNIRRKINKAERENIRVVQDNRAIPLFYDIYAGNVRRLGTPVMTRRYFEYLGEALAHRMRFSAVFDGETFAGGMLAIDHGRARTSLYVAVSERAMQRYATYALYWSAISECCGSQNIETFDLGRSIAGSGNHRFKQQWTTEDTWTNYNSYGRVNPRRAGASGLGLAQNVWSRLPLPLCNWLGPVLRRTQPFG